MKKIVIRVAIGLLGALAVFLAYVTTLPDDWRIVRSASIKAPPEKIYPLIADLRAMNQWNPFAKQDPTAKMVYDNLSSGKGASYTWDSTGQAGKGRMEIIDTVPSANVAMMLHMEKPMEAHNNVVFTLQPKGDTTEVTWAMTGRHSFLTKTMCAVFSMDKMVGGEFAKGLLDLKQMAETAS